LNELAIPLTPSGEGAETPVACVSPEARFRELVKAHFDFIWRSLRGLGVPAHSTDDATQQVFLIASQKLASIVPGSERAFLFSTALGVAANARRSRARSREVLDDEALEQHAASDPDAESLVAMNERRALLERVLGGMDPDLRTVFVLFVLEGVSTVEIAEMLSLSTGTVASRLRRAREAFHTISKRVQARARWSGKEGRSP
jgi:RNA polymerase sigma-70 factor (ECF subfamily)